MKKFILSISFLCLAFSTHTQNLNDTKSHLDLDLDFETFFLTLIVLGIV